MSIKDQIIIQEGERSGNLFLIKYGEFELIKRVKKEKHVDFNYEQFITLKGKKAKTESLAGKNDQGERYRDSFQD